MINFGQNHLNLQEKDHHDSFELGRNGKKRTPSLYEKCAIQCINLALNMTQQEATCIQQCYSSEFNKTSFKDAKLFV